MISQLLADKIILDNLKLTILLISSVLIINGIGVIFIISNRILGLISILVESCNNQGIHHLKKINLKTDNGINDATNAL